MKTFKDFTTVLNDISFTSAYDSERIMKDGSLQSEQSFYSSREDGYVLTEVVSINDGIKKYSYILDKVEDDEVTHTRVIDSVEEAVMSYGLVV